MMHPKRFIALLLFCPLLSAYVRSTTQSRLQGVPLFWPQSRQPVQFYVNENIRPGLRNTEGNYIISPDSSPLQAVRWAIEKWQAVDGSQLRLAPVQQTQQSYQPGDRRNVVVGEDTPEIRELVGSALAVTIKTYTLDGQLVDADILLNPTVFFSTNLSEGSYDLETVLVHEIGHALGAGHSALLSAAMYPGMPPQSRSTAELTADERAFLRDAYPSWQTHREYGLLRGRVRFADGQPVRGAHVVAIEVNRGEAASAISHPADGSFEIKGLTAGNYIIYVEPLDGPMTPAQLGLGPADVDTQFATTLLGGSAAPQLVTIEGGGEANVEITVPGAKPDGDLEWVGIERNGVWRFSIAAVELSPGEEATMRLEQLSIPLDGTEVVQVLGGGFSVDPSSVEVDVSAGRIRFRVRAPGPPLEEQRIGSILVRNGQGEWILSGSLIATPRPSFAGTGLVNAASFEAGAVAPGSLVTLFGVQLGPDGNHLAELIDGNQLPRQLAGVRVWFDETPAPMLFVSANQLNFQAPFEIATRDTTTVVVEYGNWRSHPVRLPVVAAQPGLFRYPGTNQVIALNQDGSFNGPDQPARPGEIVVLFGTGFGRVSPAVSTGQLAPANPLPQLEVLPEVFIGNQPVPQLLYAGLAPGFVGLYQLNLTVPAGVANGRQEVEIVTGGLRKQLGWIAVEQ